MRATIDDLPSGKQRELALVVDVLREEFARAIAQRSQPRFRNGKLLKIVLFGSYARGDWVEDPVGRYFSDYDLLVVVSHDDLTDVPEFWLKAEERLTQMVGEGRDLRTPVSPIYHSLDDVNEKLRLGRYFFLDIVRDGILLFDEPGHPFAEPQPLTPEQAVKETQDYFDEWFKSAENFEVLAIEAAERGMLKEAAFLFHQATERYYHCLFLVRTLYSPKTHNLNRLREQAENLEPSLNAVWPIDTKFEKRCYERLRAAYVKARYSRHYRISNEELDWIRSRVMHLRELVERLCSSRIQELSRAA